MNTASNVRVLGERTPAADRVLTREALAFLGRLQAEFGGRRADMLHRRRDRRAHMDAGAALPSFANAGAAPGEWRVANAPKDLTDRRVEITGPAEPKMMINALNSGANVFMADHEDAMAPTWHNVIEGHAALMGAVRRTLSFVSPEGKQYRLGENLATLVSRPRGWHLEETHAVVADQPMSASLFDFGLHFFHNAKELIARGSGPYFYLPKLESHFEARLWNDVFLFSQDALAIPRGSIRATVLVETIFAAFEMEEILYELREHAAGLNAGRWDYLFSIIKAFRDRPEFVLPDRGQLTMAVPFMRAYARRLVQICHRHGAHAIGGMAAFIPNRRDAEVTATAIARVKEDKQREAGDGFDGTWVAHPDLVPVAREIFDAALGSKPNQKDRADATPLPKATELLDVSIPDGQVTIAGVRANVDAALQYIEAWLRGNGAVAIHNLMEDAATAEISRSQLWQWIRHSVPVAGSGAMTDAVYRGVRDAVVADLQSSLNGESRLADATQLLDELVLGDWQDFLTTAGSRRLER